MLVKSVHLKTNQITPIATPVTITKATAMSSPKVKALYLVHWERLLLPLGDLPTPLPDQPSTKC